MTSISALAKTYRLKIIAAGGLVLCVVITYANWKSDVANKAVAAFAHENSEKVIAGLKTDVSKARTDAAAQAKQAEQSEAKRRSLERTADELRARLAEQKATQAKSSEQIAALPLADVQKDLQQRLGQDTQTTATQRPDAGKPGSLAPGSLVLNEGNTRKIDAALAALDACKLQLATSEQLTANCEARNKFADNAIAQLKAQVGSYESALKTQQAIIAKKDEERQSDLRAARGSWLTRQWNRVKFPVGFVGGGAIVYALMKK